MCFDQYQVLHLSISSFTRHYLDVKVLHGEVEIGVTTAHHLIHKSCQLIQCFLFQQSTCGVTDEASVAGEMSST